MLVAGGLGHVGSLLGTAPVASGCREHSVAAVPAFCWHPLSQLSKHSAAQASEPPWLDLQTGSPPAQASEQLPESTASSIGSF